ncbi:ABC transporter permease subunit [Nonomuraea sp. NBC_00507]|uniref:ABC transporter permease subunit n=1 Tax=Nonomuraea sp. NBC_00507 TaxID=2976002 RepID=UPI002E179ED9
MPAGAVLGRMLDDLLPGAFAEPWALAAAARGLPPTSVARQALRRCVPALLPNLGLFAVGLTGGAVAVEQIFDIPGLGRLTLRAALAQDLPVLQTGTLALVLLATTAGALARLATLLLIGPALRDHALHSLQRPTPPPRPGRCPCCTGRCWPSSSASACRETRSSWTPSPVSKLLPGRIRSVPMPSAATSWPASPTAR